MTNSSIFAILLTILICACSNKKEREKPAHITDSDLKVEILRDGMGSQTAKEGQIIGIKESTKYRDGTLIFSTDQIGGPLRFTVGANQVIEGVDEGVRGMRIGEIRKLIVPPSLSKRSEYPDNIHPDSILVYEIELVEIME